MGALQKLPPKFGLERPNKKSGKKKTSPSLSEKKRDKPNALLKNKKVYNIWRDLFKVFLLITI